MNNLSYKVKNYYASGSPAVKGLKIVATVGIIGAVGYIVYKKVKK